jgi:hypothetical protein
MNEALAVETIRDSWPLLAKWRDSSFARRTSCTVLACLAKSLKSVIVTPEFGGRSSVLKGARAKRQNNPAELASPGVLSHACRTGAWRVAGGLKAPGTGRVEPGSLSESVSNSPHFDLVREIPEAMKPRAMPIASFSKVLEVQPTKLAA